jgi:hypothetical protein
MPSEETPPPEAPVDGAGGERHGILVPAAAWLGGFLLVLTAARQLTPWPEDFPVTTKLEWLAAHPDQVDTLYIGKSHVFRSFIPPVIDERLAADGKSSRSFNMGAEGMSDCEIDHVLRTVLEIEGLQLQTVYIEAPDWVFRSAADQSMDTNRSVNWHTPRQTWRMLRRLLYLEPEGDQELALDQGREAGEEADSDGGWSDKLELAWSHLRNCWLRTTSFGQGKRIVAHWLLGREDSQVMTLEEVGRERGFQAMDDVGTEDMLERRRRFVSRAATGLPLRIAKVIEGNAQPYDLDHYNFAALEAQMELVRAAGAEPVYFIPPAMHPSAYAFALDEGGYLPSLLVFNDPERFRRLYVLESRFDSHLNRAGATLFSKLFASAVAQQD